MISKKFRSFQIITSLKITGVELVCVDIVNKYDNIRVIVLYRSTLLKNKSLDVNNELICAINELSANNRSIILMGDFNLPNFDWISPSPNYASFAFAFLECFSKNGLTQVVNSSTRNMATLDLVFTNVPNLISCPIILPPLGASDHDIVSFDLILNPIISPDNSHAPVRNFMKCNFDSINLGLSEIYWNTTFILCKTADEYWNAFLLKINLLVDENCPLFTPRSKSAHSKYTYPANINHLNNNKLKVWRLLRLNKTDNTLRAQYKVATLNYRKVVYIV